MAIAMGATQVDQHAGERPVVSPDHAPAPPHWEPDASGHPYLYLGIGLIVVLLILLLVL